MKAQSSRNSKIVDSIYLRFNRRQLIYLSLLLFIAGTLFALYQPVSPDATSERGFWQQFLYPVEHNPEARLPSVSEKLNDLVVIDDHIWVVGDGGLILHSADAGHCWQPQGPWIQALGSFDCVTSSHGLSRLFSANTSARFFARTGRFLLSPAHAAEPKKSLAIESDRNRLNDNTSAINVNAGGYAPQELVREEDVSNRIKQITAEILGINVKKIIDQSEFKTDLGATDFDLAELVLAWEDTFAISIPDDEARQITTIRQAVNIVIDKLLVAQSQNVQQVSVPEPETVQKIAPEKETNSLTDTPENLVSIAFNGPKQGLIVTKNRRVLVTRDGGENWNPGRPAINTRTLRPYLQNSVQALSVDQDGNIHVSLNQGKDWELFKKYGAPANIYELPDRRIFTINGQGLLVIAHENGGQWIPAITLSQDPTQPLADYSVSPALWWYPLLLLSVALLIIAVWPRSELAEDEGIAGLAASDKPLQPGDPDALNLNSVAADITTFLSNPQTTAPLTMAITGPWGSGKSSLMNLIRADLQQRGFSPVWFNAWHHQKGEQLLASLFAHIKQQAIPSWFSFDGIWFRLKLAVMRSYRHWFIVTLLVGLLFLTVSLNKSEINEFLQSLALLADPKSWWQVPWENWMPNIKLFFYSEDWIQTLASIFGIGAPLLALIRSVRGFGINPSKLVSIDQGANPKKGYDPGARARFAKEFNDVTWALGNNKMVIFIDDLDRCTQDNLIDILENINFLSSSGDCFLIVGMAPKYIEACVANAYEKLAQSIAEKELHDKKNHIDDEQTHKFRFAHNYLEKMINIEVPIPGMQEHSIDQLFNLQGPKPTSGWSQKLKSSWDKLKASAHIVVAVLFLVVAIGYGWEYGRKIPERPEAEEPPFIELEPLSQKDLLALIKNPSNNTIIEQLSTQKTQPGNSTDLTEFSLALRVEKNQLEKGLKIASIGKGENKADILLKYNPRKESDTVQQTSTDRRQEIDEPKSGTASTRPAQFRQAVFQTQDRISVLNLLLGLLLFGSLAYYLYKKKRDKYAQDSEDFKAALITWTPWIQLKQDTPRAVKRFLNHLRFLAIRNKKEMDETELVAMASIYFYNLKWLKDDKNFDMLCNNELAELIKQDIDYSTKSESEQKTLVSVINTRAEKLASVFDTIDCASFSSVRTKALGILEGALPDTTMHETVAETPAQEATQAS